MYLGNISMHISIWLNTGSGVVLGETTKIAKIELFLVRSYRITHRQNGIKM
jgi:hypothetical protein